MRNFEELFAEFECEKLNNEFVKENVQNIINQHYNENNNVEVYKQCLNQIDLTTLNGDDTCAKVETMVEKVNNFKSNFSIIPFTSSTLVKWRGARIIFTSEYLSFICL